MQKQEEETRLFNETMQEAQLVKVKNLRTAPHLIDWLIDS